MCCVHMRMKKKKKKICVHIYIYIFLRDERVRTWQLDSGIRWSWRAFYLWFINYVLLIFLFKQD